MCMYTILQSYLSDDLVSDTRKFNSMPEKDYNQRYIPPSYQVSEHFQSLLERIKNLNKKKVLNHLNKSPYFF